MTADEIRLYLDEDAQRTDLIKALRARHIDVLTASEAGLLATPDSAQLDYATQNGRVIFSFNRGDFFRLHTEWLAAGQQHAGIVVSDQLATNVVARRLLRLIDGKPAGDMKNWLEFLSNWR
ncbi:MAG: DUF5615 family PIN-like protein [Caldilineaceae bacterium]|nr:DUF5615 family PIN-like protein [Caldilineaceae bacterium]